MEQRSLRNALVGTLSVGLLWMFSLPALSQAEPNKILKTNPGSPVPAGKAGDLRFFIPKPAAAPKTAAQDLAKIPPIAFYIASGKDGCGHGCDEWIVAEGRFVPGSADQFRAALRRAGKRKLPVFFNSPGGEVRGAIAIGRLMRQRGLMAGVAVTLPEACSGLPDEACRAIKHSGKPVPAHLLGYGAQCNSACVYTLLGGLTRDVEPGAQLGVHAVKLTLIVKVRGNVKIPQSKLDAMGKTRLNNLNHGIRDYVEEMGIDPELFSIATKVPPSQVHFLTRDDIVRLRIDTRKNVETPWEVFEGKSNPPLLIKSVVGEAGGAFGQRVRAGMLAFTCDRGTGAVLIHSREPDGSNEITLVSVVAGKRSLAFPKYGSIRKTGELSFVVRGARVPRGFFTANDSDDHFSVLEVGQSAGAEQVLTFSMSETSAALDRFQQICTRAPTVQKQTQVRGTPSAKLSL